MRLYPFSLPLSAALALASLVVASAPHGAEPPSAASQQADDEFEKKLREIVIPRVEFRGATLREAVDFLAHRSRSLDQEPDPAKRGVNVLLRAPETAEPMPLTFSVYNISLHEALRSVAALAELKLTVHPHYALLAPLGVDATKARVTIAAGHPDAEIVERKLRAIVISRLEFRDATLREACSFLSAKARQLDPDNRNPKLPVAALGQFPPVLAEARLTLSLQNVPLGDALEAVATLAGAEATLLPDEVILKAE